MKIIPLSEGAFTVDKTKHFIPFDKQKDVLQHRSTGSLLVEIQPFCVITSKDVLVIDTGLGFTADTGLPQIHQNLLENGINPADVTKVLLSHLHKDHSGGIRRFEGQQQILSFPNASHYVNRRELNFGLEKGEPSFRVADFKLLADSDKTVFVDGNGTIDGYIRYETTGAHSPFHMVFWIEEEGERVFFGGDVAPQLQQMKNRFIAKYDYDGKQCMELRQRWWQEGKEQGWTFLFYHDIKTPVFKHG